MGSNGTVFSVSYTGGDGNDIVLRGHGRTGPRTEHMDRRCACDRRARFHAAPQTAEDSIRRYMFDEWKVLQAFRSTRRAILPME